MVKVGGGEATTSPNSNSNDIWFGRLRARDHRTFTALIFVCTVVAYWERVGFSIAFTDIAAEIGLTDTQKGFVFSAFYYGYALTQVPGGYLASRYGGKAILTLSFALWVPLSAMTALSSGSPDQVVASVFACRLMVGMAQGILLPSSDLVLAHWVPSSSRGRFFAFAVSGKFLGAAVSMVTVPIIVSDIDASATFYIAAWFGAAWLAVWVFAGSDSPPPSSEEVSERFTEAAQKNSEPFTHTRSKANLQLLEDGDKTHGGTNEHLMPMKTVTSLDFTLNGGADGPDERHTDTIHATSPDSTLNSPALTNGNLRHSSGLFRSSEGSAAAKGGSQTIPSVLGCGIPSPMRYVRDSSGRRVAPGDMDNNMEKERSELQEERTSSTGGTRGSFSNEIISSGLDTFLRVVRGSSENNSGKRWSTFQQRSGSKDTLCGPGSEGLVADYGSSSAFNGNGVMRGAGKHSTGDEWSAHQRSGGRDISGCPGSEVLIPRLSSGSCDRAVAGGKGNNEVGDRTFLIETTSDSARTSAPAERAAIDKAKTMSERDQVKPRKTFPWRAMAASPAAWACVAANTGATVGINVVMSWLPTYFEEFISVELQDLGVISLVAPYLTMMVFSILGGHLYCWLTNTLGMSTSSAFKVILGVSFALAICLFLSMGFATSTTTGVLFSSLALASMALSRGGWCTYHVEIASLDYTAMLYSFANTVSSVASVFVIALTGKILDAYGGAGEAMAWVVAMGAVGGVCGACGVFFLVFAEGDEMLFHSAVPRHGASLPQAAPRSGGEFETILPGRVES